MDKYSCLENIARHARAWESGERSNTEMLNHAAVAMSELGALMIEIGKIVEANEDFKAA